MVFENDSILVHVHDFELKHLQQHPVWTLWHDSLDDCLLEPVSFADDKMLNPQAYGMLSILCNIELRDGLSIDGCIELDGDNDGIVYLVIFYKEGSEFGLSRTLVSGRVPQVMAKLVEWFDKPLEQILPFKYTTDFVRAEDGKPIAGTIDFRDWG